MTRSRKRRRGATLVELLIATGISVLVMTGALTILFTGSASWATGLGKIGAETDSQMSVRTISELLAQAMSVTVDTNGMGLTYQLPQTDGNGNFVLPMTWDGVTRRIAASNNQLVMTDGNNTRVIANGLIFTDPVSSGGTTPYRLFTPGPGALTRQVTIEVATQWYGYRTNQVAARNRETIFLRNIPSLTQ